MLFGHLGGLNFTNLGTCGHSFYSNTPFAVFAIGMQLHLQKSPF